MSRSPQPRLSPLSACLRAVLQTLPQMLSFLILSDSVTRVNPLNIFTTATSSSSVFCLLLSASVSKPSAIADLTNLYVSLQVILLSLLVSHLFLIYFPSIWLMVVLLAVLFLFFIAFIIQFCCCLISIVILPSIASCVFFLRLLSFFQFRCI